MKNKDQQVAIIGVACRFPGGITSLNDYWDVLKNEIDTISEIPDSRWSKEIYGHPSKKVKGHSYIWSAGVLANLDQFDADFFGISRREAEQIDPQQRLLLELTWEALEAGGLKPEELAGSQCGVFIGVGSNDYALRRIDDLGSMNAYSMTGNTASVCSNRISYAFDFKGPSFSVDTACSSSLVALHQACSSLRSGESTLAIAGGVNMLLHPMGFVGFAQASMLSPTGRCHAFDASGDGYVRSEGAAIVVLKPLEDAQRDGDQIYAVIYASGINSDGKTNGISMPSSEAQARLLESIYTKLEIDYNQLSYIEAHGTGTAVGDPLETHAISTALATKRDKPLLIGSAKTNLGHLEVASGMAGLLKAILCLQQRAIPASLHFNTPNPNIPFADWNLKVAASYTPLMETSKPLLIGINSFGFGGTNAHVVLEEYVDKTSSLSSAAKDALLPPLYLSARTTPALQSLALTYAELITAAHSSYYDLAWSAFHHRQPLEQRLAVYAESKEQIVQKLRAFAHGEQVDGVVTAKNLHKSAKLALVYSGNGSQWQGMGCTLYQENALFRAALDEVDQYWQQLADFSIVAELFASEEASRMELTEIAQPTLFAIQVGITRMLLGLGLKPNAALGHSVGEIAAAWVSGRLTLTQAVKVIYERSYAQAETKSQGKMAAVVLSAASMQEWLIKLKLADKIVIAGINSPNSVTISGSLNQLISLKEALSSNGVIFKMLDLDYAFHSPSMDSIQERLLNGLKDLEASKAQQIRFISTVSGKEVADSELDAEYWWKNIRLPVEFSSAIDYLIQDQVTLFIEVGPHMVLARYIEQCLKAKQQNGVAIATLKRQKESSALILNGFYQAQLAGAAIDTTMIFPEMGHFTPLPSYPWQREQYWAVKTENSNPLIERVIQTPLLGYRQNSTSFSWENALDTTLMPWLADHEVGEAVVLPAAVYVEMALAVAALYFKTPILVFEDMEINSPIVLNKDNLKIISTALNSNDGTFSVRVANESPVDNIVCRILEAGSNKLWSTSEVPNLEFAAVHYLANYHYQLGRLVGLNYGPAFQTVKQVWVWQKEQSAWAELAMLPALLTASDQYLLHPTILDGCFQLLLDIFSQRIEGGDYRALIPVRIGKLTFIKSNEAIRFCRVQVTRDNNQSGLCDFVLFDAKYKVVAELKDVRFRAVSFIYRAVTTASYTYTSKLMPYPQQSIATVNLEPIAIIQAFTPSLLSDESRSRHFAEVLPLIDVLVSSYAYQAVKELTATAPASNFSVAELVTTKQISNNQLKLFNKLLLILEQDGLIEQASNGWTFTDEEIPAADLIWRTILADYASYLPELTLLAQVGTDLTKILAGVIDAKSLFTSNKSSTLAHFYSDSESFAALNHAILAAVQEVLAHWPKERRLRILELSAGNNELTKKMLSTIPLDICDYVTLDANEEVINNSKALFEELDNFTALQLNIHNLAIELPAGISLDGFDLVIAANVLSNADEHQRTIQNIRRLLIADGLLLVAERDSQRFTTLVNGINSNWWLVDEESKAILPRLFPASAWQQTLEENGFAESSLWHEAEDSYLQSPYLLVAKNAKLTAAKVASQLALNKTCVVLLDDSLDANAIYEELFVGLANQGYQVIKLQAAAATQIISDIHYAVDFNQEKALTALLAKLPLIDSVIYLAGFTFDDNIVNSAALERCWLLVQFLQAWGNEARQDKLNLSLITCNGAVFEGKANPEFKPTDSALWGLGRVIINEYSDLKVKLIDLCGYTSANTAANSILEELALENSETESEVVKSASGRHVLRMRQKVLTDASLKETNSAAVLDFKVAGSLNNLYWRKLTDEVSLARDEIQIRPFATGLNFRDVMYAMGMLSDEAVENGFAGASLGMELAGVVEKIGDGIREFKVGDEVISFAPACFSTRVITKTTTTALKPAGWNYAEAATVPTAFFTVYYALNHLANLKKGERILIHGAAGGVGLAAIQYAKFVGAEIYATAGTEEKRNFVRAMGADHVFDSRSLAFADEVMHLTGNIGVDVVLNSLSGEAVLRNLSILRPFGRFLELGKRDFYANSKIGLRPFRNNISYFGIDADQLLIEREDLAAKLFKDMMLLFDSGHLKPLPSRVFAASQVEEAFRYMQQSRQIGKVVVSFANSDRTFIQASALASPFLQQKLNLCSAASYLVTGGTSGFGLQTAKWLAKCGARSLVLVSRSGVKDPLSEALIAELTAMGVACHIHQVDIADFNQVESLIKQITANYPPLKGVIHAAAVIDDALIRQLDKDKFERVLKPKIDGAWNLHRLTQKLKLEFFVVYSSMTTFLGNPGQANYVAANSYLEGLTHYRRAHGYPANYAAFGAIADAGFLTRNQAVKDSLESRIGTKAMPAAEALAMLEKIILAQVSGAAICDFDWNIIGRYMPAAKSAKYEQQILHAKRVGGEHNEHEDIRSLIAGLSHDDALELIIRLLAQSIGKILHIPAEKIDRHKSVFELGMDSLMGVELAMSVEADFSVKLPLMALAEGATLAKLAVKILAMLEPEANNTEVGNSQVDLLQSMANRHGVASDQFFQDLK